MKQISIKRQVKKNEDGTYTLYTQAEELFKDEYDYRNFVHKLKGAAMAAKSEANSLKNQTIFDPDMDGREKARLLKFAQNIKDSKDFLIKLNAIDLVEEYEEKDRLINESLPTEYKPGE